MATYAQWLEDSQCFELSEVPIPCYQCGEGTVVSCSLFGVYVCNDCSEPDENDDSICLDCLEHACKKGVHYHHGISKRLDEARYAALATTLEAELTERQRKILQLMGEGITDAQMEWEFGISEQKLTTLMDRIKQKTGLQSRAELVQLGRSINRLVEE